MNRRLIVGLGALVALLLVLLATFWVISRSQDEQPAGRPIHVRQVREPVPGGSDQQSVNPGVIQGRIAWDGEATTTDDIEVTAKRADGWSASVSTDARGKFEFSDLEKDTYEVLATGFGETKWHTRPEVVVLTGDNPAADIVLRISPSGASIEATVLKKAAPLEPHRFVSLFLDEMAARNAGDTDRAAAKLPADQPLAGVMVLLEGDEIRETATSDGEGRVRFRGLPPGTYKLTADGASAGMPGTKALSSLRLERWDRNDVKLLFSPQNASVMGHVRDTSGRPVADVHIWAQQYKDPEVLEAWPDAGHAVDTRTDSDGRYRLESLWPPDRWTAFAVVGGASEEGRTLDREIQGLTYSFRLEHPDYAVRTFSVPIITAEIARDIRALATAMMEQWQPPSEDEEVSVGALDEFIRQHGSSRATMDNFDFTIFKSGTLSGTVYNRAGQALPNIILVARYTEESRQRYPGSEPQWHCETASNSEFLLSRLPPGTFEFAATDKAGASMTVLSDPITLHEGQQRQDIKILVDDFIPRGTVVAQVVDAKTGEAVTRYAFSADVVEAASAQEAPSNGGLLRNQEDPSRFTIENVAAGLVEVNVLTEEYAPYSAKVEVLDQRVTSLKVELQPAGLVRVRVLYEGKPVPDAIVNVYLEGKGSSYATRIEDDPGTFEVSHCPLGPALVWVSAFNDGGGVSGLRRCKSAWVDVESGVVKEITFEMGGDASLIVENGSNMACTVVVTEGGAAVSEIDIDRSEKIETMCAMIWEFPPGATAEFSLPSGPYEIYAGWEKSGKAQHLTAAKLTTGGMSTVVVTQ